MREFLSQWEIKLSIRDFFVDPFKKEELLKLLGSKSPQEIVATRSPSVKSLGLDLATISNESLIENMIKEPKLLRRPMVVIDGIMVAGANENNLLELLS